MVCRIYIYLGVNAVCLHCTFNLTAIAIESKAERRECGRETREKEKKHQLKRLNPISRCIVICAFAHSYQFCYKFSTFSHAILRITHTHTYTQKEWHDVGDSIRKWHQCMHVHCTQNALHTRAHTQYNGSNAANDNNHKNSTKTKE